MKFPNVELRGATQLYRGASRLSCIGCSRMGDVWLTKHFERENGYDLRIDIDDCTDWEVTPNV